MKKNFYTIILAANFVTSTALFCGNTASTAKKPCEVAAKVEAPSTLSSAYNSVKENVFNLLDVKAHWANHRNVIYVGGAVAVVALIVAAKKCKLKCNGVCPFGFGKKGGSKPSNQNNNQ